MISPLTVEEATDSPQTLYKFNGNFTLSNGEFNWVRLNSLTPVTVLHDRGERLTFGHGAPTKRSRLVRYNLLLAVLAQGRLAGDKNPPLFP